VAIRTRILIVVLALVLVALAVLSGVSYVVVRRSLISSADTQLQNAESRFYSALKNPGQGSGCYGLPLNSFGTLYYLNGRVTQVSDTCPAAGSPPIRRLPPDIVTAVLASRSPVYETVRATSGAEFRLEAQQALIGNPNGNVVCDGGLSRCIKVIFVVGEPLKPALNTLRDVILLDILVSSVILIAVGTAAYFLVRLGLRPLEEMSETAGEIAAGDLSRRVELTDSRTEVGELGASLNVMLSRIEEAFRGKEASEEQLRRFVADASHELRTPLTSIRGYAELFRDGKTARPEDLAAALRRIESESARMSGLVEDLFLLARLDQGRPLERAPVDLWTIAEDAVRDARVVAPDRAITLTSGCDADDLIAIGDEQRLRQVVANLVSNALAHTPAGTPVEVSVGRDGPLVRLAVTDHGPGVAEGDKARIFDRFWRADESRHRSQGGSGLGLSIVAAVVGAHAGRVFVADTPGGGATFVVELPAAVGEPHSTQEGAPQPPHRTAPPASPASPGEPVEVPTYRQQ
jgi:two-component system OmpR family sensor kinase